MTLFSKLFNKKIPKTSKKENNDNNKPIVLVILDGFGVGATITKSPWEKASHPNFKYIEENYPFTTLQASGIAVGLPWGEPGNSEVGHLTIGSGKTIYTHLQKISLAIEDETFFQNQVFKDTVLHTKKFSSNLHLMGLFSSGSVHAYKSHLYALLDYAKKEGVKNLYLHLFTDGRDAQQKEGLEIFKELEEKIEKTYPFAKIASIIGRGYAMDRDGKWDKIESTYNLLVNRKGEQFNKASEYIEGKYKNDITDEFINPGWLNMETKITDNDALIFINFREDSARELTRAFIDESFDKFPRIILNNFLFASMTQYDEKFNTPVLFPPIKNEQTIAKIISEKQLSQIHIAETEKYAHVTYFFNGGKETPFLNEKRILIKSPRVSSYDELPAMSASKITDAIIDSLSDNDFILANFANADLVGHTGNFNATIKAMEVLDQEIGKIKNAVEAVKGTLIITSDHGNAEEKMYKFTGEKRTKHSTNPVPLYLVSLKLKRSTPLSQNEIKIKYKKIGGILTDVAPTILELLKIKKPAEMTGESLLKKLN